MKCTKCRKEVSTFKEYFYGCYDCFSKSGEQLKTELDELDNINFEKFGIDMIA